LTKFWIFLRDWDFFTKFLIFDELLIFNEIFNVFNVLMFYQNLNFWLNYLLFWMKWKFNKQVTQIWPPNGVKKIAKIIEPCNIMPLYYYIIIMVHIIEYIFFHLHNFFIIIPSNCLKCVYSKSFTAHWARNKQNFVCICAKKN